MNDTTERAPVASHTLGSASIQVFGKPHDYYFSGFEAEKFTEHAALLSALGIPEAAVPFVGRFNARTATYADFRLHFSYPTASISTGLDADVVILSPGQSGIIITADCPTLVVHDAASGHVAAAHAGRDSIVDRTRILTGEASREHEGVLASLFAFTGWNPVNASVFICAGIAPGNFSHPFSHPEFGEQNRKFIGGLISEYGSSVVASAEEDGCIDLFEIVRAQARTLGVPDEHISPDDIDTYTNAGLWSNRNSEKRTGRNAIVVRNG